MAPASQGFEIVYDLASMATTGVFAWRQAAGLRRWDVLKAGGSGSFAIQHDASDNQEVEDGTTGCLWYSQDRTSDVQVLCGQGIPAAPIMGLLDDAIRAGELTGSSRETTIAGRRAVCRELKVGNQESGDACLEVDSHILLSFDLLDTYAGPGQPANDRYAITAKAVKTSTAAGDWSTPQLGGFGQGPQNVARARLELPAQ